MKSVHWRVGAALLAAAACLFVPIAARASDPPVVGALALDHYAFWTGPFVESGHVENDGMCGSGGPCFDYLLDLTSAGNRLRVAIDQPNRDNTWALTVIGPNGDTLASGTTDNAFSIEVFVADPVAGRYRIHVAAASVDRSMFRMRAKLESPPPAPPTTPVPLLPHLRAVPPFEFTFTAPANPLNGLYPPDTANPPLDVAGAHPVSCTADETQGSGVQRCLRFTSGPFEAGGGPFHIDFDFAGDTTAQNPYTAYQVVYWSDGSKTRREAGTYDFHAVHGHFHYDGILDYELYKVDQSQGTMQHVGAGNKSGFCPADQQIGEWLQFNQSPAGTYNEGGDGSSNCFSFSKGSLGLSTGWGDVYRWQRPGQFVDFDGQGDGYYVVQAIVDIAHNVEGTQGDNVSYAYIHIVGDRVDILERGLGTSPWDSTKQTISTLGGPLR